MAPARRYEASFFTATILDWKFLLANNKYKDIVVGSLRHLVQTNKVLVHAFVIMDNHIHLLWHILHPYTQEQVQLRFMRYTAQMMVADLRVDDPIFLKEFYVGQKDREYQIWERNPLPIDIWSESVLRQKLEYIHSNPVRAGICEQPEDYKYCSASVYMGGNDWDFLELFYFTY